MARYQTIEKLGNKQFTMSHGTLRHAMLYAERHYCTLMVNGIIMPSEYDDTFFYASVEAAEDDKVWVEEAHAFMSQSFKSTIEGGCVDKDDLDREFAEHGGWEAFVIENIYTDVFGYTPVTGEDGHVLVYDEDVANICKKHGYDVLPCVKESDGMENYWMVFPQGGEEEYLKGVYTQKKDTDPYHQEMFIDWHLRNGGEYSASLDLEWFWHTDTNQWKLDGTRVKASITVIENEDAILNMTIDGHTVNPIHHKSVTYLMTEVYQIFDTDEYYVENGVVYHRLDHMPYDRNGSHATGVEYLDNECIWHYEYEDDLPEEEEVEEIKFAESHVDSSWEGVSMDEFVKDYYRQFEEGEIIAEPKYKESLKNSLTEEALAKFGKGKDFAILTDFIGDAVFGNNPWQKYKEYFDDRTTNSSKWAFDICAWMTSAIPDWYWAEGMSEYKSERIWLLSPYIHFDDDEIAYLKSLATPTVTAKVISTREHNCGWRAKAYHEPNRKINGSGYKSASANFVYMWRGEVFCRQ